MPSPSITTVIDDFNRADGAVNAGAGASIWTGKTPTGATTAMTTSSNQLAQSSAGIGCITSVAFGPNIDYTWKVPVVSTSGNYIAFWWDALNALSSSFTAYCLIYIAGTGWQFRKYVNNVSTVLVTFATPVPSNGDTVWVNMNGTTMTAYLDAGSTGTYTLIGTRTDTSIVPTNGPLAFEFASSSERVDDLKGGTAVTVAVDNTAKPGPLGWFHPQLRQEAWF